MLWLPWDRTQKRCFGSTNLILWIMIFHFCSPFHRFSYSRIIKKIVFLNKILSLLLLVGFFFCFFTFSFLLLIQKTFAPRSFTIFLCIFIMSHSLLESFIFFGLKRKCVVDNFIQDSFFSSCLLFYFSCEFNSFFSSYDSKKKQQLQRGIKKWSISTFSR